MWPSGLATSKCTCAAGKGVNCQASKPWFDEEDSGVLVLVAFLLR